MPKVRVFRCRNDTAKYLNFEFWSLLCAMETELSFYNYSKVILSVFATSKTLPKLNKTTGSWSTLKCKCPNLKMLAWLVMKTPYLFQGCFRVDSCVWFTNWYHVKHQNGIFIRKRLFKVNCIEINSGFVVDSNLVTSEVAQFWKPILWLSEIYESEAWDKSHIPWLICG